MIIPIKQIITENLEIPVLNPNDEFNNAGTVNGVYKQADDWLMKQPREEMLKINQSLVNGVNALTSNNPKIAQEALSMDPANYHSPLDTTRLISHMVSSDNNNAYLKNLKAYNEEKYANEHPVLNYVNHNPESVVAGVGGLAGAGYLYNRLRNRNQR